MVGPPYPAVARLIAYAERYWPTIDGEAASQGADYLALPLDRFCNTIEWWVSQRVKDPERFVAELERPLPGDVTAGAAVTERELEADADAFMAFASAFGLKPPSPREPAASA